jgi:uncharacterized membrane protein YhhN
VSAPFIGITPESHFTLSALTGAAWVLLAVAAVAAVVDWWAAAAPGPGVRARVELVAKPAVLAALIGVAATLHTAEPTVRKWFLAGLVFCLVGDVFLMLPRQKSIDFQAGLGAFLVAHVLFLIGLSEGNARLAGTLVALAVLVVVAAAPAVLVLRAILRGGERSLAGPVVVYMLALLTMAAAGWSAGLNTFPPGRDAWLCVGVTLFVLSDTLLALDKFVHPLPLGKLAVHASYHLAVSALVISLAGFVPFAGAG